MRINEMKKVVFTIFLAGLSTIIFSQEMETSLKKNIFSADIGLFGVWVNYERHLGGLFTLKSEAGLEVGFGQDFFLGNYFVLTPNFVAEPRYYYNFNRRVKSGKKTSYNASNYFALSLNYFSNPYIISNDQYKIFLSEFSLMPKWGIKRTIGRRLNFEFAFGSGFYFSKAEANAGLGLDLRFGYYLSK
jgi:hypothetical protein